MIAQLEKGVCWVINEDIYRYKYVLVTCRTVACSIYNTFTREVLKIDPNSDILENAFMKYSNQLHCQWCFLNKY